MKEDLTKIKEKIRALKALASNEAATEGEVTAALNLAQKLCHEYMLNLADIEDDRVIQNELEVEKLVRDLRDYKISRAILMDVNICNLFDCEMVYNDCTMRETIIGTEQDRITADYCIDFAHNSMHTLWNKYKRSQEYAVLRERFKAKQLKKDFMTGYCYGVVDKIREMKKLQEDVKLKTTGTSLMIIKSSAVEKYKNSAYPNLKQSKFKPISFNSERTRETGREQGRRIEFTKPIGENKTCQPLLS